MKKAFLLSLIIALTIPAAHALIVTNTIDAFIVPQYLEINNSTTTNTTTPSSTSIIGGYRTVTLGSSGSGSSPTSIEVDGSLQMITLSTPSGSTPTFKITWGGLGGTNGLGGFQFGGGLPLDLATSFLTFSLKSADLTNNFTWTLTDTSNVAASYTGTINPYNPDLDLPSTNLSISLSSFANANSVNWNAINFIVLSGGNVGALDLSIEAPIQVVASTVPEPGTFALLIAGLGAAGIYVRCRKKRAR